MANMCYNGCSVYGYTLNINSLFSYLQVLEKDNSQGYEIESYKYPKDANRWMFDVCTHEPGQEFFSFESRWTPTPETLLALSAKFLVSIECEYEEMGNQVFGKIKVICGKLDYHIPLPDKEFDLGSDDQGNTIDPQGLPIESEAEYYEQKLQNYLP